MDAGISDRDCCSGFSVDDTVDVVLRLLWLPCDVVPTFCQWNFDRGMIINDTSSKCTRCAIDADVQILLRQFELQQASRELAQREAELSRIAVLPDWQIEFNIEEMLAGCRQPQLKLAIAVTD